MIKKKQCLGKLSRIGGGSECGPILLQAGPGSAVLRGDRGRPHHFWAVDGSTIWARGPCPGQPRRAVERRAGCVRCSMHNWDGSWPWDVSRLQVHLHMQPDAMRLQLELSTSPLHYIGSYLSECRRLSSSPLHSLSAVVCRIAHTVTMSICASVLRTCRRRRHARGSRTSHRGRYSSMTTPPRSITPPAAQHRPQHNNSSPRVLAAPRCYAARTGLPTTTA